MLDHPDLPMNRIPLLLAALCAFAAPAAAKPNILVILADDLGWGELGCQGFTSEIPTPHIDSLANNGVRFTSGYVSGPYCSPTGAGFMTGRYQVRFGHEFNTGPGEVPGSNIGLPLSEVTIGDRLKAAGYATGWFGKSHLGYEPQFHPLERGFDECCFGDQVAIRMGDWKLVKGAGMEGAGPGRDAKAGMEGAELYNFKSDVGETTNLAAMEPERVSQLAAAWDKWNAENVDAKWVPEPRKGKAGKGAKKAKG